MEIRRILSCSDYRKNRYSFEYRLNGNPADFILSRLRYEKESYYRNSLNWKSGSVLSFQPVSRLVFSALKGLTSVFGMGTGGTPSLLPPETVYHFFAP